MEERENAPEHAYYTFHNDYNGQLKITDYDSDTHVEQWFCWKGNWENFLHEIIQWPARETSLLFPHFIFISIS